MSFTNGYETLTEAFASGAGETAAVGQILGIYPELPRPETLIGRMIRRVEDLSVEVDEEEIVVSITGKVFKPDLDLCESSGVDLELFNHRDHLANPDFQIGHKLEWTFSGEEEKQKVNIWSGFNLDTLSDLDAGIAPGLLDYRMWNITPTVAGLGRTLFHSGVNVTADGDEHMRVVCKLGEDYPALLGYFNQGVRARDITGLFRGQNAGEFATHIAWILNNNENGSS